MSLSTNDAVDQITAKLQNLAEPRKKEWWDKYLKHVIEFYGVPMADIRTSVKDWVNLSGLLEEDGEDDKNGASSIAVLKQTAWSLIEQPVAEQKLAGILIFQNHVDMSVDDLSVLEKLFQNSHIYDWNTTDWLCVRVLGPLVSREGDAAVAVFKSWVRDTESAPLWQRRAALVAFVNIASEHCDHVLEIAGVLAQDEQRFAQTAVGWVLRNLASAEGHTTKVVEFLKQNKEILSAEAINMASAKMSEDHRRQAGIIL